MATKTIVKSGYNFMLDMERRTVVEIGGTLVSDIKVVLEGYCRCPDSHDLSECHHLYDLGRHI